MPKRKQKKAPKNEDPLIKAKVQKLQTLLQDFKDKRVEYEEHLNQQCKAMCDQISKLYSEKLNSIPDHMRNMTISQIFELQAKENTRHTDCPKDEIIRSNFERVKIVSEKKKTLKKERKRSLSASAATRPLLPVPRQPSATHSRLGRATSDLTLSTPLKLNRIPNSAVTPKFNPKLPVTNVARKPKPGEIFMSLSGSPLQNEEKISSTKVVVPLGQGKVLQVLTVDEGDLIKDFGSKMDKETIKIVREELDRILQS